MTVLAPTRDHVTLRFNDGYEASGTVMFNPRSQILEFFTDHGSECLSTNLTGYGLRPAAGQVFIKGWSEHSNLAPALEEAGVIEIIQKLAAGPFASPAYLVKVLI